MILLVDSSQIERIYLALGGAGKLLFSREIPAKFSHSEKLIPEIDKLLRQASISPGELEGIVVVSGPGSFTALRIGLAVVNALAWAYQIKNVGLSRDQFVDYQDLLKKGEYMLNQIDNWQIIEPVYGKEPNISTAK